MPKRKRRPREEVPGLASLSETILAAATMEAALKLSDPAARETAVLAMLEREPSSATTLIASQLPLHIACRKRGMTVRLIDALIKAHPAGAGAADAEGMLPMHLAAANRAPRRVISSLLEVYSEAARTADASAYRLPLHYAAVRKDNLECISAILGAHPAAAGQVDGDGQTPAALAVSHSIGAKAIQLLNEAAATSAPPPPRFHYNSKMHACNVWEVDMPEAALAEARTVFERCELASHFDRLRRGETPYERLAPPSGVGERWFARRIGGGGTGWSSDVTWMSADDLRTHASLEGLFERCELARHFEVLCGCRERLRMYSASFVVRSRCNAPNFHTDYVDGVRSAPPSTPDSDRHLSDI